MHNPPSAKLGSNKPPAAPDPAIYVDQLHLKDGRLVWVSFPQPDRLSLNGYLSEEFFAANKSGGGADLAPKVMAFAKMLQAAQVIYGPKPSPGFHSETGATVLKASYQLGPSASAVQLGITKKMVSGQPPTFSYRLDCNPRKLMPDGFKTLIEILHQASPSSFNSAKFFAAARLSRLDVAIDVVGVTPSDVMVRSKTPFKTVSYRAADRHLETVQFHREKKPAKVGSKPRQALGKLELKVYDRNRQHAAMSLPPPVPGHVTTRLEVVRRHFPKAFGLSDLVTLDDQFKHLTVRDRRTANPLASAELWAAYVACRLERSEEGAASALSLDHWDRKQARHAFLHKGDFLLPKGCWAGWQQGLDHSGLGGLITLAAASQPDK